MKTRYAILIVAAIFALAMAGRALPADGIQPGTSFKVPFLVDGKAVSTRAKVTVDAAGNATLTVLYVKADDIAEVAYTLKRLDGTPEPGPDPKPEPKPTPIPPKPVENLWGIVVEESSERTPQQAIVLASLEVRKLFKEGEFRIIDKDSVVSVDLKPYVDRAKTGKLPTFFLVEPNGVVHYEGVLPATVAECVKLVGEKKGGK